MIAHSYNTIYKFTDLSQYRIIRLSNDIIHFIKMK
jgi:hypothetical protein